jgi:hypothetical protein
MNFLRNRRQATIMGGFKSQSVILEGGVPQGTVSGPKLFNLYINDLPLVVVTGMSGILQEKQKFILSHFT